MADSGGHWKNLTQVQLLTESDLIGGVVDESPKRGGILPMLPVRQARGQSIKWNRSLTRRTATRVDIGAELVWMDNVDYTQKESELKIFYDQTPLNKYVRDVYNTFNDYAAQQMLELRTGIWETLEDAHIYDDTDYNSKQITGHHHWAVDNTGTDGDIDEGEGPLSLMNMRRVITYMRHGVDFIRLPFTILNQISAFYSEAGHTPASLLGSFVWGPADAGKRIAFFDGVPLIPTDYLVAEQANTGVGSNARAKRTSGTEMFSMIFVKMGRPSFSANDPGVIMTFGGDTHANGQFFRPEFFPTLQNYDAAGLRVVNYSNQIAGSILSTGRIYDITDTPVTE
ncbi:hypothetical protein LCGC14_1264130 [marine sediment metagenome]|uniref:Capsid protein n=1 Tax=marine sediment metagenome TaxID=412755 RepID=A0A0F9P380_9ZZZZ